MEWSINGAHGWERTRTEAPPIQLASSSLTSTSRSWALPAKEDLEARPELLGRRWSAWISVACQSRRDCEDCVCEALELAISEERFRFIPCGEKKCPRLEFEDVKAMLFRLTTIQAPRRDDLLQRFAARLVLYNTAERTFCARQHLTELWQTSRDIMLADRKRQEPTDQRYPALVREFFSYDVAPEHLAGVEAEHTEIEAEEQSLRDAAAASKQSKSE